MSTPNEDNNLEFPGLDDSKLTSDLNNLFGCAGEVPPEIDSLILAHARNHFVRHRRMRFVLRAVGVGAAAACILAVIWLGTTGNNHGSVAFLAEDIDQNGQVDIRDAFTLARRIESPDSLTSDWDISGDGKIDAADVDLIARSAVHLDGGTVQ